MHFDEKGYPLIINEMKFSKSYRNRDRYSAFPSRCTAISGGREEGRKVGYKRWHGSERWTHETGGRGAKRGAVCSRHTNGSLCHQTVSAISLTASLDSI